MEDTAFKAMQAQARFENGRGDENVTLHEWLSAEIAHAHASGIDWIMNPPHPVETLQDYNNYKLVAHALKRMRSLQGTSHIKVA